MKTELSANLELVRYTLAELSEPELDALQHGFVRSAVRRTTPRGRARFLGSLAKLVEAEQRRRQRLLSDFAWSLLDAEPERGARVIDMEQEIAAARRQLRGMPG